MAHNPEWHRAYLVLENAERSALIRFKCGTQGDGAQASSGWC